MKATGRVDGAHVRVDDAAAGNRLYSKGIGVPQDGGATLTAVEAAFAMDQGKLRVFHDESELQLEDILRLQDGAEVSFLAYRDMRERGLLVRHLGSLQVWERGKTMKQEPWFHAFPYAERDPVHVADLLERAGNVLSVVDEDGSVLHYKLEEVSPLGDVPIQDLAPAKGAILSDRVMVDGADWSAEHIGTQVGEHLLLSFTEAAHLQARGVLDVPADLPARARARQLHFEAALPVHEALRSAGVVSRSGFRFGTHLRGYQTGPDESHATWLIQCVMPDATLAWSELSRAVRLSHGVRKTFLIGIAQDPVRFLSLTWFRP